MRRFRPAASTRRCGSQARTDACLPQKRFDTATAWTTPTATTALLVTTSANTSHDTNDTSICSVTSELFLQPRWTCLQQFRSDAACLEHNLLHIYDAHGILSRCIFTSWLLVKPDVHMDRLIEFMWTLSSRIKIAVPSPGDYPPSQAPTLWLADALSPQMRSLCMGDGYVGDLAKAKGILS